MTIKLKGILDSELTAIGLEPGMIIHENPDIHSTSGVVHFETIPDGLGLIRIDVAAGHTIEIAPGINPGYAKALYRIFHL